jgi:hypothetical protein
VAFLLLIKASKLVTAHTNINNLSIYTTFSKSLRIPWFTMLAPQNIFSRIYWSFCTKRISKHMFSPLTKYWKYLFTRPSFLPNFARLFSLKVGSILEFWRNIYYYREQLWKFCFSDKFDVTKSPIKNSSKTHVMCDKW